MQAENSAASAPGIKLFLAASWRRHRFPILLGLGLVWWTVEPHLPLRGKALAEIYGQVAPQATRTCGNGSHIAPSHHAEH